MRLVKILAIIAGIPGLVVGLFLLFGIKVAIPESVSRTSMDTAYRFGPAVIIVIIVLVAAETAYRMIRESHIRIEANFYQNTASARRYRGHYALYSLFKTGQVFLHSELAVQQAWDRDVQAALVNHCQPARLHDYLMETGRSPDSEGEDNLPLQASVFQPALDHLLSLLDPEVEGIFK